MAKKIKEINIFQDKSINITKSRKRTADELKQLTESSTFNGPMDFYIEENIKEVSNNFELASSIIENKIDMNHEINKRLEKNKIYKDSRASKTPALLLKYQKANNKEKMDQINQDIINSGVILAKGQKLFHGGLPGLKVNDVINMNGILSTTLNPHVAISNASHNNKACDSDELNLIHIDIMSDDINAFIFNKKTSMAHENEVLLEKDLEITIVSKTKLNTIEIENMGKQKKEIPFYLSMATIRKKPK